MLTYELVFDTGGVVKYTYCPENAGVFGSVEFNVVENSFRTELAPNDPHGDYARKLMCKIRKFTAQRSFRKRGTIAWC